MASLTSHRSACPQFDTIDLKTCPSAQEGTVPEFVLGKANIEINSKPKDVDVEKLDAMTRLVSEVDKAQRQIHEDAEHAFVAMTRKGVDPNVAATMAHDVELKRLDQLDQLVDRRRLDVSLGAGPKELPPRRR
jgi:hypothetical protein